MQTYLTQLYQHQWIALPRDVRNMLVRTFGLIRTGITEVRDQTVVSDGYTNEDLKGITIEKLAEFTKHSLTEPFSFLMEQALSKIHYQLHPILEVPKELKIEPQIEFFGMKDSKTGVITPKEEIKRFCDKCNSKGGLHKKDCPTNII